MAPIVIGLMLATGWILAAGVQGRAHLLLTAATAVLVWRTRVPLLWLIGAGAALGALGLV
jgi:chromate transporter